jgi:FlaA1/EpsC-like NDP-sugar epimerase
MGVTKRISEMIVQSKANANTRFSIVRFGNVIGSSGSVIPLFEKQISQGGPITVTHEDVIRYFMTITEASQLVIQAGAMGNNGEVFLLDMGKQVKIYDLAKKMIHLRGLTIKDRKNPDGDIEISIIGLGKGEKLFEELVIGKDSSITKHPRILVSKEEGFNSDLLINYLEDINSCIESFDEEQIIDIFQKLIPDFNYQK